MSAVLGARFVRLQVVADQFISGRLKSLYQ